MDKSMLMTAPFQLTLDDEWGILEAEKILRALPHKRVVVRARFREHTVLAKLFFHARAKRHAEREVWGSQYLKAAHILTPKLKSTATASQQIHIVLYEFLEKGQLLSAFMHGAEALHYALKAIAVLSQLHQAGLRHCDLHLDNFYVRDGYLYVLDAASITHSEKPITGNRAFYDLACLIARFAFRDRELIDALFKAYVEARQLTAKQSYQRFFQRTLQRRWQWEKENRLRKIYRCCTAVVCVRDASRRACYVRQYESDDLLFFMQKPQQFLVENTLSTLKKGNTCSVFKAKLDDQLVVVKRYPIKNRWHGLKRALSRSRADRSWYNAHLLQFLKIPTPAPIAFFEKRWGGLKREAYYMCEYKAGLTLDEYFQDKVEKTRAMTMIVNQVLSIFQQYLRYHLVHGDLKASNWMVSDGRVFVLDLDALYEYHGAGFSKQYAQEVTRFLANWKNNAFVQGLFSCLNTKKY